MKYVEQETRSPTWAPKWHSGEESGHSRWIKLPVSHNKVQGSWKSAKGGFSLRLTWDKKFEKPYKAHFVFQIIRHLEGDEENLD